MHATSDEPVTPIKRIPIERIPIERIVVTGDVLRTANGDANQLYNVRWLRGEVSRVLYELTGLLPDIRYRRNQPDDGRAAVGEWYRMLGHAPSSEAWAATYAQDPPASLVDALRPDYERALVIGFELSPLLRAALARIGVPWIDIEIGPIRFLDDLTLDITFSWPVHVSHPGLLQERHVRDAVRRMQLRHLQAPKHASATAACRGACIFLGQTRHDRTLIKDGAFFSADETAERLAAILNGRRLVLKPHPLQPENPILDVLHRRFAAPRTEANIYALLATARDVRFVSISSSAAIEAAWFGQPAEQLHVPRNARPAPISSLWAHRCAAFWRAVLAPLHLPLKAAVGAEEPMLPDRRRHTLGAWWGLEHRSSPGVHQPVHQALRE